VLAIASFVPAIALLLLLSISAPDEIALLIRLVGGLLALLSLATVASTAMIYASLKPIPAWRHSLVLPGYLLFALLTGGLLMLLSTAPDASGLDGALPWLLILIAGALLILKLAYWRSIDHTPLPQHRGDAIGLPQRTATVFERPHTEANYITREMAFVVARTHARRLRLLAVVLFAMLPILSLLPMLVFVHSNATLCISLGAISALAGAFVERWLFFAQARHMVTLYY
jgi:DMSO reductase anchor subunit